MSRVKSRIPRQTGGGCARSCRGTSRQIRAPTRNYSSRVSSSGFEISLVEGGGAGNSRVNSTLSAIAYRAIVSEIFRKLFLGFAVKVGGKRGERSLNDEAVMGKTRGRRMGEFERAGYDF